MLTILCALLLTYVILSYMAGAALFVYELPRNPRDLIPFGILLLVTSPVSAPFGVHFYYKEYLHAREKALRAAKDNQE